MVYIKSILALLLLLSLWFRLAFSLSTLSATPNSVGERIQQACSVSDLMEAAGALWLPTDPNLASHLITQRVHQEKRLRWAGMLLHKLGSVVQCHHEEQTLLTWDNPDLERAVLAASIPFESQHPLEKEGRYLKEALIGVHTLIGSGALKGDINHDVVSGIETMFQRAQDLADSIALPEAIEIRWACRGISTYLAKQYPQEEFRLELPQSLEKRTARLPFDIIPAGLDWETSFPDALPQLKKGIPFNFDTIVTRTGSKVTERRATAWIANEGIGALAYSGKLMAPQPVPSIVQSIMEQVENQIFQESGQGQTATNDAYPRPFFDCALCNYYPDAESACKFHTDPEHGSHWERLTCVVSAGQPRRFAFRPIPGISSWSEWDTPQDSPTQCSLPSDDHVPAVITLFSGDVVKMQGSCNDDFHHAVYPEQSVGNGVPQKTVPRVSLVLKRAIVRSGDQKGHGIAGQGRRSRRRSNPIVIADPVSNEPTSENDRREHSRQPRNAKAPSKRRRRRRS